MVVLGLHYHLIHFDVWVSNSAHWSLFTRWYREKQPVPKTRKRHFHRVLPPNLSTTKVLFDPLAVLKTETNVLSVHFTKKKVFKVKWTQRDYETRSFCPKWKASSHFHSPVIDGSIDCLLLISFNRFSVDSVGFIALQRKRNFTVEI